MKATFPILFLFCFSAYSACQAMDESSTHKETVQETIEAKMHRSGFRGLMSFNMLCLFMTITEHLSKSSTIASFMADNSIIIFFALLAYYELETFYYLARNWRQQSTASSESSATPDTTMA